MKKALSVKSLAFDQRKIGSESIWRLVTRLLGLGHPDEFLSNRLDLAPGVFCGAIHRVRARLKNPPYTVNEYLDMLTRQGLVATAAELATFDSVL